MNMLATVNPALSPAPHAPAAMSGPASASPQPGSAGSPGFARLLGDATQAQAPHPPSGPAVPPQDRVDAPQDDPDTARTPSPTTTAHAGAAGRKPDATAAGRAAAAQANGMPSRSHTAAGEATQAQPNDTGLAGTEASEAADLGPSELTALLAQMQAAPASPAPAAAAAAAAWAAGAGGPGGQATLCADAAGGDTAPTLAGRATRPALGLQTHAGLRHAATPNTANTTGPAAAQDTGGTLALAQAVAGGPGTTVETTAAPAGGVSQLPAATFAPPVAATSANTAAMGDGATAEAQLHAPPGSAEFAPQLGAQLTTFARDGVEHARLHLNPADMGPVMVQIQLDGQAAQIHMSADHAATRQALEQAMPALASSLREAGLTLAGGGVFEQPQQAQDQAQADGSRQGRSSGRPTEVGPGADSSAPGPVLRRRGVVDLVA